MKIELRHFRYNPRKSEAYRCFSATVLIDGEVAGTAAASGDGSINDYAPFELRERLQAYANTLPKIATEFTRDGTPLTFQPNCDYVIGALVEERIARWLASA